MALNLPNIAKKNKQTQKHINSKSLVNPKKFGEPKETHAKPYHNITTKN